MDQLGMNRIAELDKKSLVTLPKPKYDKLANAAKSFYLREPAETVRWEVSSEIGSSVAYIGKDEVVAKLTKRVADLQHELKLLEGVYSNLEKLNWGFRRRLAYLFTGKVPAP